MPVEAAWSGSGWVRLAGAGRTYVRSDWLSAFQEANLREGEDFFSVLGEPLSKPGLGQRYRARLCLKGQNETHTVYLKRFSRESLLARLRRWFETGHWQTAAEHEVRVAIELAQQQIPAAQPLAWGSKTSNGFGRDSFVVLETVPGQSIHQLVRTTPVTLQAEKWRHTCRWVEELAALIRRFHDQGWSHRDLYLSHVFLFQTADNPRFALIDLQRIFCPRWRKQRWRIKDLAQLNYSAGRSFSRSMRMRFARHYLGCTKLPESSKAFLRRIQRKTDWIARHSRVSD